MTEQTKIIQLGFTTLEFHSQLVISKIKEDVILEEAQVEIMREKCLEVFEDRKSFEIFQVDLFRLKSF